MAYGQTTAPGRTIANTSSGQSVARPINNDEGQGISLSFRTGADGTSEMRLVRKGDFMATTRPDGKTYKEGFTGEPAVLIRGLI